LCTLSDAPDSAGSALTTAFASAGESRIEAVPLFLWHRSNESSGFLVAQLADEIARFQFR